MSPTTDTSPIDLDRQGVAVLSEKLGPVESIRFLPLCSTKAPATPPPPAKPSRMKKRWKTLAPKSAPLRPTRRNHNGLPTHLLPTAPPASILITQHFFNLLPLHISVSVFSISAFTPRTPAGSLNDDSFASARPISRRGRQHLIRSACLHTGLPTTRTVPSFLEPFRTVFSSLR